MVVCAATAGGAHRQRQFDLAGFLELQRHRHRRAFLEGLGHLHEHQVQAARLQLDRTTGRDLKAPLDERYAEVAGRPVDVEPLRCSMAHLRRWGGAYEFRTTVGPQVGEDWLQAIAPELLPGEVWYLQMFRAPEGVDPDLAAAEAPDEDALAAMAARLAEMAPGVRVRGVAG